MDALTFSALFTLLILCLALLARVFDHRITLAAVLGCTIYLVLDDLVTGLPHLVTTLDLLPGAWNWSGKLLSIGLAFAVIKMLRIPRTAVGLNRPQNGPGVVIGAVLGFVIWGVVLGYYFRPGQPDAETLLYQSTMPGFAEELAYRGIAPSILLGQVRHRSTHGGIPWVVICLTAAVFGIWHALQVTDGRLHLDMVPELIPFLGSLPGGYLRFRTNSLWVPIACHGAANLAFHAVGGLL
ncbi:MAG: CPBP family intramembrane metalloprotease [Flavobacteriales bacterium]|nr:CPBP family intramembrane metalloprotease [Flavobacteriales bacterium]